MTAQVTEPRRELVRACYPGTFHPPTVAHLAVAHAAIEQLGIDRVVFVLSRHTLGKDDSILPAPVHRAQELKSLTEIHGDRFDVAISNHSLLVEIAGGFDWVIVGADKWHQINELRWYSNDRTQRDAAVAALPRVAIVPRPPFEVPERSPARTVLHIAEHFGEVSSTAVRAGRLDWRAT